MPTLQSDFFQTMALPAVMEPAPKAPKASKIKKISGAETKKPAPPAEKPVKPCSAPSPAVPQNPPAHSMRAPASDVDVLTYLTESGRKLEAWERDILENLTVDGFSVKINSQLLPEKYQKINSILKAIGGRWIGKKTEAHVFDKTGTPPRESLDEILRTGIAPDEHPLDFFPTPTPLADDIAALDELHEVYNSICFRREKDCLDTPYILEPSAGRGAFVQAVNKLCPEAAGLWDMVEQNPAHYRTLTALNAGAIINADFLKWTPPAGRKYKLITMNPPFTSPDDEIAYVEHVRHAHSLLEPNGTLIAIIPISIITTPLYPKNRKETRLLEFRNLVLQHGDWIENHPKAFATSGTTFPTMTLILKGHSESGDHQGWTNYETWQTHLILENNNGYRERHEWHRGRLILATKAEDQPEIDKIHADIRKLTIQVAYDHNMSTTMVDLTQIIKHADTEARDLVRQGEYVPTPERVSKMLKEATQAENEEKQSRHRLKLQIPIDQLGEPKKKR